VKGRYVRVQLTGTGCLSLAEVQDPIADVARTLVLAAPGPKP